MVVFAAVFTVGGIVVDNAYAETAKEKFDRLVESAELEFAETVTQAKADYKAIADDPTIDDVEKTLAKQTYNKIIADAKILKDQKIDQARAEYEQSLASIMDLNDAKQHLVQTINNAKLEYEKQLEQAKITYEESLAGLTDNEEIEALEDEYDKIIDEIKRVFNNAIMAANEEYQRILALIGGDTNA